MQPPINTKRLTTISLIAAIYVVITVFVGPIAYGPLQFRVSEVLKPLALKGHDYILGLTLGLFLANLFSPFIGPWELLWMPFICYTGGHLTYALRKLPYLALTLYSAWIAFGVSTVLYFALSLPITVTWTLVFFSELILMYLGGGLLALLRRTTPAL